MIGWLRSRRRPSTSRWRRLAAAAPCEPLRAPEDPLAGVVNGPRLVERTTRNRAVHEARYRDDEGFPVVEWGPFTAADLGWSAPDDAA